MSATTPINLDPLCRGCTPSPQSSPESILTPCTLPPQSSPESILTNCSLPSMRLPMAANVGDSIWQGPHPAYACKQACDCQDR